MKKKSSVVYFVQSCLFTFHRFKNNHNHSFIFVIDNDDLSDDTFFFFRNKSGDNLILKRKNVGCRKSSMSTLINFVGY